MRPARWNILWSVALIVGITVLLCVGCAVHFHSHFHTGGGHPGAPGKTGATTQPAERKSFIERLLEDVAE